MCSGHHTYRLDRRHCRLYYTTHGLDNTQHTHAISEQCMMRKWLRKVGVTILVVVMQTAHHPHQPILGCGEHHTDHTDHMDHRDHTGN